MYVYLSNDLSTSSPRAISLISSHTQALKHTFIICLNKSSGTVSHLQLIPTTPPHHISLISFSFLEVELRFGLLLYYVRMAESICLDCKHLNMHRLSKVIHCTNTLKVKCSTSRKHCHLQLISTTTHLCFLFICRWNRWRNRDLHHLPDGVRQDPATAGREGRQASLPGPHTLCQAHL